MNDAHLHMIINHFPIVGSIFGVGILAAGIFFKSDDVRKTAYFVMIVSALTGFASMYTGEGAEEVMENFGGDRKLIHHHEELAEQFVLVVYAMGALAIIAFFATLRKWKVAPILSYLTLAVALAAVVMSKPVGTSGGEIRHVEIRQGASAAIESDEHEDQDDADVEIEHKDKDKERGRGRGRNRRGRD